MKKACKTACHAFMSSTYWLVKHVSYSFIFVIPFFILCCVAFHFMRTLVRAEHNNETYKILGACIVMSATLASLSLRCASCLDSGSTRNLFREAGMILFLVVLLLIFGLAAVYGYHSYYSSDWFSTVLRAFFLIISAGLFYAAIIVALPVLQVLMHILFRVFAIQIQIVTEDKRLDDNGFVSRALSLSPDDRQKYVRFAVPCLLIGLCFFPVLWYSGQKPPTSQPTTQPTTQPADHAK